MTYVYDDEHVINTMGLRVASITEKINTYHNDEKQHFWVIEVVYKGTEKTFRYDDEKMAREMFDKLLSAIKKSQNEKNH